MNALEQIEPGHRTPSEIFGELFAAVAMADIIPAKDWADAMPKSTPAHILQAFRAKRTGTSEALLAFVVEWFDLPAAVAPTSRPGTLEAHIEATWPALVRMPTAGGVADSLLPLPKSSLAPGGRFRECYYWDTYFALLGLHHRPDLVRASAENFRWQVEQYGFVPNANRTYYLSRSQPPLLFKIVELLAETEGSHIVADFLPALVAEHAFWMDGDESLKEPGAFRRVVRLPDGALLNRYWDDKASPRDEAWRPDILIARAASGRDQGDVYRDIRAACESGWDFSSRWLAQANDFSSIMTTAIVPPDLNSALFGLERFIASAKGRAGDAVGAERFERLAARRRESMNRHLWNETLGAFDDFDWRAMRLRNAVSASVAAPMFFGLANAAQARATAQVIEKRLVAPGGVLATAHTTDLQWDAPNGWAPIQWIVTEGLDRYGFNSLSADIRRRWLETVEAIFLKTGRMFEKYNIVSREPGGGGEYVVQDGFGWTNGITAAFLIHGGCENVRSPLWRHHSSRTDR